MSSGPTLRHTHARSGRAAPEDAEAHEKIVARMLREMGGGEHGMVFHEIVSELVHIDVHHLPPSGARDYHVLFTTGMSDALMNVPEGAPSSGYAELFLTLPRDWKIDAESWKDERWYWPVRWLKTLARLPAQYDTWLGHGHTVPNGDPATPFAPGTLLSGMCAMLYHEVPSLAPMTVDVRPDKTIELFELYPLTSAEMDLKLRTDAETAITSVLDAGHTSIIDHGRACSVTGRKPEPPPTGGFFKRWFGG